MSHEIRTPMNAVFGTLELLQRMDLSAEIRNHVETISFANQTLLAVIGDVLDFSKIEHGQLKLQFTEFSLHGMLEKFSALMTPLSSEKSLKLNLSIAEKIPDLVYGDATRLQQILWNLVSNAIKFTRDGSISIRAQYLKSKRNKVTIAFIVEDTGVGIPQHKLSKLFDPFIQVDSSRSRHHQGTGLGLAICKQLVHLMNGSI